MTRLHTTMDASMASTRAGETRASRTSLLAWRQAASSHRWRVVHDDDRGGCQVLQARLAATDHIGPAVDHGCTQMVMVMAGVVTVQVGDADWDEPRSCRPGDVARIPAGHRYLLRVAGVEGAMLIIVRARTLLGNGGEPDLTEPGVIPPLVTVECSIVDGDRVALHRATEAAWPLGLRVLMPQDLHAFDATLLDDPAGYRVGRVGPFEYVADVQPVSPALMPAVGDRIAAVAAEHGLPVYVEGSQSPLSLKPPCATSDVDVLVAVDSVDEVPTARAAARAITGLQSLVPAPIAAGIVLRAWLALPNFYSAVRLGPTAGDRRWWQASRTDRLDEARRRIHRSIGVINDVAAMASIQERTFAILRRITSVETVREVRLVPRWLGLEKLPDAEVRRDE